MKPKIISLLLGLAVLVSLTACGGDPAESASNSGSDPTGSAQLSTPAPEQTTEVSGSGYSFAAGNGAVIIVNENMTDALAALGEPQSYFEAESCAFDGLDKTYTYPGFIITTRPDGDQDFINSIRLTDDSVTTREGAYIGYTADQVKAVYGDPQDELETALYYTDAYTMLSFILEDGVVISIEYLPA